MPSKQLHNEVLAGGSETAKHHGPKGRNDFYFNRKNKFPGGRNVSSEILLEILSSPLLSCYRARILSPLLSCYPTRNLIQSNPLLIAAAAGAAAAGG